MGYHVNMNTSEIEKMSSQERIETMELIWDVMCRDEASVASPAWHGEVLKNRKHRIESGEARFYSLDEVRKHFEK
jgi:hypothetical protein